MRLRTSFAMLAGTALATGCAMAACAGGQEHPTPQSDDRSRDPAATITPLSVSARPGSAEPNLFVDGGGRVHMSWLEPAGTDGVEAASTRRGRFALRFSTLEGDTWSEPRTIAEREDFFVNWADFPSIVAAGNTLVAHWLELNGGRGTSYDVHISRSTDGGASWEESVVPHTDSTATEHGFVSLVPEPDGGFTAVWLDGRNFAAARSEATGEADAAPSMTLRAARFDASGSQKTETLLDDRICDCCQTSATYIGGTLVAVYRDRSPEEIRDIWAVRRTPEGWQEPTRLAHDDWQIPGCPVNGPSIASAGDKGAVAWFSLRDGAPEVKIAFTHDAGASFAQPILLDRGAVVGIDGGVGRRHAIATTGSGRASGFPQIVRQSDRLIVTWTDTAGGASVVRTAATPVQRY